MPVAWCNDDERCKKAAIPEDKRRFQGKTQLALAMLKISQQRGIQFGYVGIDDGYGKQPAYLRAVDEQGCRFVANVHCCHSMIWLQHLSIFSPTDNSRLKNWRTLSASVTIYAERLRNHTPDGLKWRLNESEVTLTHLRDPSLSKSLIFRCPWFLFRKIPLEAIVIFRFLL